MYRFINRAFDHLNRRSPILIQTPNNRSFGNGSEEVCYGLLRAQRENKKVLFLYPRLVLFGKYRLSVVNKERFHLQSDYSISNENIYGLLGGLLLSIYLLLLRVLDWLRSSPTLRKVLRLIRPKMAQCWVRDAGYLVGRIGYSTLWKPDGVNSLSFNIVEDQNWPQQYKKYIPPKLTEDRYRYCEQTRLQMGISLTDWFVCLHVSETRPLEARNALIQNYVEAIKAITNAGGWVVRLGDAEMTPLPPMDRVIDYAHSRYKSEVMDLYLISQCDFFIGNSSGPPMVATLFRKPRVIVNMTVWSIDFPLEMGDMALIKHIFSRSRNRFLSIKEIMEEPYTVEVHSAVSEGYEIVENTAEEIRDVVEEFLSKPKPFEYSDLQRTFNEARRSQVRRWLEQGEPRSLSSVPLDGVITQQYRIASLIDAPAGTLGQRYLEQNWLVDDLDISSTSAYLHRATPPDGLSGS